MAKIEPDNKQFAARLEVLRAEVDALQAVVMNHRAPWYTQIPIIVSIVALLFSFSTTYVAFKKAEIEEIKNSRTELRGLLQRLSELPIQTLNYGAMYAQDSMRKQAISGLITQENSILSEQAAEVARKLPPDYITAAEYYALAVGLSNSYDIETALMFYSRAATMTKNLNIAGASLRGIAQLLFAQNKMEESRNKYREAMELSEKMASKTDFEKTYNRIMTLVAWAGTEAAAGNTDEAEQLLEIVESILTSESKLLATLQADYGPIITNMRHNLRTKTPGPTQGRIEP
jgi:hypothetical protein